MTSKAHFRLKNRAAYQGGAWQPRRHSHREEREGQQFWCPGGSNSEFRTLKSVILFHPAHLKTRPLRSPDSLQHLRSVDWSKLAVELESYARVLRMLKVQVHRLEENWFTDAKANLLFTRDHFFMTPWGAVVGRMASCVRAGEEKWAQLALARLGLPILSLIQGQGTFEGADALWISPREVWVGVGNRTNPEGYRQLRTCLKNYEIRTVAVRLPRQVQHLLGLIQIVGPNTVLVRTEIAGSKILRALRLRGLNAIEVPESDEVIDGQGMNVVTLSARRLIMPHRCPSLKALYLRHGLKVVAEVAFDQGLNAAGGLACATGILSRALPSP